jgi:hypothetical protein
MLCVYCDSGGFRPELLDLARRGQISLFQFKYENRNRHIKQAAVPSASTWEQMNYTWDEMRRTPGLESVTYDSIGAQSSKFQELLGIVGVGNRTDAQHLDSAYATQCSVFLTSDKDDIWSKRDAIREVAGLTVLHVQDDWAQFLALAEAL